ncbi:MAG: VOC family protein [Bacteroidetes bacterium]|nr:VOC family protein [Bacteroidota bacterium]
MNLNQITIPSLDIEKAIAFYQTLGLKLIVKALPHYARFECPDGNSTFSVHKVEQLPSGDGVHIYFECTNLDNYVNELISKGIEFDEMPNDKNWLWREAHLKDIDNNHLILYFAGENRLNPPWRLA